MRRKLVRWIPAIAAPALVAAAVGLASIPAQADIPVKTPAQVVALAAGSKVSAFSGTLSQTSDLGLPSLPAVPESAAGPSSGDAATQLSALTGPHTARLYVAGPQRQRLQVMSGGNEQDFVHDGTTAWLYDSATLTATRVTAPAGARDPAGQTPAPGNAMTPQQLADRVLAAITPSTRVSVAGTTRVAGRDAYRLELQPKTSATLVDLVSIDVDAATGMALGVDITARGQATPALAVTFTSVSLRTPPASRFDFTPPADATLRHVTLPGEQGSARQGQAPTIVGSGWTSVVELPGGTAADLLSGAAEAPTGTQGDAGAEQQAVLNGLTRAVAGGRLLSTSLVNVYLTDTGRVFAGAVPPESLYAAARQAQ
ncbi:MAG TPA: hypothetical protein VFQ96_00415 [Microbacteriaceae bacterium]|nr:hypothetical protein [Microbacteriaceae bacterium]